MYIVKAEANQVEKIVDMILLIAVTQLILIPLRMITGTVVSPVEW